MAATPGAAAPAREETRPVVRPGRETAVLALVLGACTAIGPLSIDMYLPALPEITSDLASRSAQIQLTLTGCLVGLAVGQLVIGPWSDTLGRKRPMLVGTGVYVLASLACALAPSAPALTVSRLVQGFAGAAAIVVARAVVSDLFAGAAAARFFARLMLVTGLAPILAPVLGAQVLRVTTWRGVFVVLAGLGVATLLAVQFALPETLPADRRHAGGLRATAAAVRAVASDRVFVGLVGVQALGFAALFGYVSGSPFVVQEVYGGSPVFFSVLFGVNSLGLVAAGQLSGFLVGGGRVSARRLLAAGLVVQGVSAVALVGAAGSGLSLWPVAAALFGVAAPIGLIIPNATALGLGRHREAAGSASALLGSVQFLAGAVVAPLVGLWGQSSALPMAVVVAVASLAGSAVFWTLARSA